MNDGFVCIKVDREERPDIDAVYMNATVALTGQGGWPMTCFLTPDGRPFFCGTYYPKDAFLQLLSAVSDTWRDRRGEVEQSVRPHRGRTAVDGIRDCPAAARRSSRRCATTPSPRCCATRTPRTAASAAHRSSRRRRCWRRCCGTGSAPAHRRRWTRSAATGDRDGPRRHLRPTGRRLRPLQRRQRLGGTAFREDAVRQRAAAAGLRALGPANRRPVGAPGHRRDRAVPARRSARRRHVHLVAGRRRRRPRGLDLRLDAGAADRGARRRRRALGRIGFRCDRGRHVRSTARRCCSCPSTPTIRIASSASGPRCWPPG